MKNVCLFLLILTLFNTNTLLSNNISEREKFDKLSKQISNWGRWGPEDQLGTLNNISNEKIEKAKELIIEGKTISLARNLEKNANQL